MRRSHVWDSLSLCLSAVYLWVFVLMWTSRAVGFTPHISRGFQSAPESERLPSKWIQVESTWRHGDLLDRLSGDGFVAAILVILPQQVTYSLSETRCQMILQLFPHVSVEIKLMACFSVSFVCALHSTSGFSFSHLLSCGFLFKKVHFSKFLYVLYCYLWKRLMKKTTTTAWLEESHGTYGFHRTRASLMVPVVLREYLPWWSWKSWKSP